MGIKSLFSTIALAVDISVTTTNAQEESLVLPELSNYVGVCRSLRCCRLE